MEELEAKIALFGERLSESEDEKRLLREENKQLKQRLSNVEEENKQMREERASLKTTISAVVARGIGAKANSSSPSNYNKKRLLGTKSGHEGRLHGSDQSVFSRRTTCSNQRNLGE
jgi:cell shape-determining protein MreC